MNVEYVETVVIGAGQQGCGVAGALRQRGRDAVVVERAVIGQAWAHERWDSMLVGSGNRSIQLPGWGYDGNDPSGLPSGPEVAAHLRRYVEARGLHVLEHTPVRSVEVLTEARVDSPARFHTHRADGDVLASRNVVAAVGGYAIPRLPDFASAIDPAVTQLHSRDYRNPAALSPGAVLVVGAGISGQQIADELLDAGRDVYVAVGRHRAWPRRYRGHTLHEWMHALSLFEEFVNADPEASRADPARVPGLPVNGVKDGGDELNLGTLAHKGATLVGSVRGARPGVLLLDDNVVTTVTQSAQTFRTVLDKIDEGIRQRGFVVPEEVPGPTVHLDGIENFGPTIELARHDISTIIWCTGFGPDYGFLPSDALDTHGVPITTRGMLGALPGLYFAGLPEGTSVALTSLSASTVTGPFIAQQIHTDAVLRSRPEASLLP